MPLLDDHHTFPRKPLPEPSLSPYNNQRIGWEIERAGSRDGYYGIALYTARNMPGLSGEEHDLVDRFLNRTMAEDDYEALRNLGRKIYSLDSEKVTKRSNLEEGNKTQEMSEPMNRSIDSTTENETDPLDRVAEQFFLPPLAFLYSKNTKAEKTPYEVLVCGMLDQESYNGSKDERESFATQVNNLIRVLDNRNTEILALRQQVYEMKTSFHNHDLQSALAMQIAARDLPEGWQISIEIERGAGTVILSDAQGNKVSIDASTDQPLSVQISNALNQARALDTQNQSPQQAQQSSPRQR